MLNLSRNNPEKDSPSQDRQLVKANLDEKPKGKGLGRNILNAVEQGRNAAGSLAGTTLQTVANAIGSGGQIAELVLAGKLSRGQVPNYGYSELALIFEEWLRKQKRGEVTRYTSQGEGQEIFLVKLKENGFLSGDYLFAFAPTNSAGLESFLKAQKNNSKDFDGIALVIEKWDEQRFTLDKDLSCFVWCNGVRLGKGGAAPDYLSAWLVDLTGRQFEKRDLIEEDSKHPHRLKPDATFTGRAEILAAIGHSVVSTDLAGQGLPWLFSVSSVGGAGKSYLLSTVQKNNAHRIISARLDHVDYIESKYDLINLLGILATKFRLAGLPTPNFDKLYRQITQSDQDDKKKQQKFDIARQVGQIVSGQAARNVALQLSKTFNKFWFVKHAPGLIGVGVTLLEMGLGLFGQLTQEQQAEIDILLKSQPVQELTEALASDLGKFVNQQREKYFLWRRPLLVFDTYEQAGPVVDQWLRTVFLANPAFRLLEPVVLIAGRFELLTYDSRWSDFQSGLRNFRLQPFDYAETTEYLRKLGITDPQRVANLFELTGGLPLFLHLAANLTNEASIIKVLAERMLEEVSPEWRDGFLEMAVPEGFNLETARRYTNPKTQAETFYEELVRASFVEYRGNLWHFLPAVRQIFLRYREMKGRKVASSQ